MKRVVLFKNGTNLEGKVILVPSSLQDLLAEGSKKLHMSAKCVYTAQGGLIDEIDLVRDDDVLYLSNGESFIPPPPNECALCRCAQSVNNQEWIHLNVGGKIYTTTRSTLVSKEPNSMLSKMFGGGEGALCPGTRDANGAYLIDRSHIYFEPLLNYLRTGVLVIDPGISPQGVLEEARFFGLESIVREVECLVEEEEESCRRSSEDEPLTRTEVISALLTTKPKQELRFQAVNLKGANLARLDLRSINFKYADLSESNLSGANLSGCNLERANLSKSNLEGAQLLNVQLLCANLEAANLRSCNFEDPSGTRANCEGVNMRGATLEGSMMAGVNLRVATLKNCNLKNCDLRAAVLAGADLENCDLSGSDLQEANLRGANLKEAAFELMQTPLHMSQTCDL